MTLEVRKLMSSDWRKHSVRVRLCALVISVAGVFIGALSVHSVHEIFGHSGDDALSMYQSYWNLDTRAWDKMTSDAKTSIMLNPDGGTENFTMPWDVKWHLHVEYMYGKQSEELWGSQLHVENWYLCDDREFEKQQ